MSDDDDRAAGPAAAGDARETPLAAYIRYRLKLRGLTPDRLAERAGVSRSTVYRLLQPEPPSLVKTDVLHKLADALEADPRVLAELWHGIVQQVDYRDDRDDLVRAFMLATSDLSYAELRQALDIARAAATLARRDDDVDDV